jgi:hypothetical protein
MMAETQLHRVGIINDRLYGTLDELWVNMNVIGIDLLHDVLGAR